MVVSMVIHELALDMKLAVGRVIRALIASGYI